MMITRKEFAKFERLKRSGLTNMADLKTVAKITSLPLYIVNDIIKHYGNYEQIYVTKDGKFYN